MGRIRSLVTRVELDTAVRSHKCQANSRHQIKAGQPRLNVRTGRTWERYCLDCAKKIVSGSQASLTTVLLAIEAGAGVVIGDDEADEA